MAENVEGRLMAWIDEHYEWRTQERPWLKCRRCGKRVTCIIRHAAVRHGDDIEVPLVDGEVDPDAY